MKYEYFLFYSKFCIRYIYNLIFNKKKLEFDLKGTPIATNDVIDVELKDYENIGANKLEP